MYQDNFTKRDHADVERLLKVLNPQFDGVKFDPASTVILAHDVSFYPGFAWLDIANYATIPPLKRTAIYNETAYFIPGFSNESIYAFNKKCPVCLDENNVIEYVRFFFTNVRGPHGRFIIIEGVDDIPWMENPSAPARKAVGDMIRPLSLERIDENGDMILSATIVFKDSLFKSRIKVTFSGLVSMQDEELLIEDLPVLDDMFGV